MYRKQNWQQWYQEASFIRCLKTIMLVTDGANKSEYSMIESFALSVQSHTQTWHEKAYRASTTILFTQKYCSFIQLMVHLVSTNPVCNGHFPCKPVLASSCSVSFFLCGQLALAGVCYRLHVLAPTNQQCKHTQVNQMHGVVVTIIRCTNEATLHRGQPVLGWLTVFGWVTSPIHTHTHTHTHIHLTALCPGERV